MELWAKTALTDAGWQNHVKVTVSDGVITSLVADHPPTGMDVGILLPAPVNLHSHAFQRAMAGLTEKRGPDGTDSFWTWRRLMYQFLAQLTPDHVEAITAFAQMEMLEAGFAHVGEFHYLHHQPDGRPYTDCAEMASRVAAAANITGIGLTLLPVLYQQAGPDGSPLGNGQKRFGCTNDQFSHLFDASCRAIAHLPPDCRIGVAPHSLRAVTPDGLAAIIDQVPDRPIHIHLAEQQAEVDAIRAAYGTSPGHWLLDNMPVDHRWCLIHGTRLDTEELTGLAKRGAVFGLCPITESSLGDGIFDLPACIAANGTFGIGSDSNIRIALAEELRTLEYGQRLRDHKRVIMTGDQRSAGAGLFTAAVGGGAQALAQGTGHLGAGAPANMLALDDSLADLASRDGDQILDSFVFCGDNRMVRHVWSAGRHVVRDGRHFAHDSITTTYHNVMQQLITAL